MTITAANMGFVGWVKFDFGTGNNLGFLRATSCDLKVTQTIDPSEVIDGTIDRTVYKLGPKEIGGSVAFPAVLDQGTSGSAMARLWNVALQREGGAGVPSNQGGFAADPGLFNVLVKYSNGTAFNYTDCIVDNYEWSVTQSDVVTIKVALIGKDRVAPTIPVTNAAIAGNSYYPTATNTHPTFSNTRIITWNDVNVNVGGVPSEFVRSFTCTVNNNVKRYYSLNGALSPSLVAPTKRDITGNVAIIGRNDLISGSTGADGNYSRCSADQTIGFSVFQIPRTGSPVCAAAWGVEFPSMCIFEYEEIALTNELFETKINYKVFPGESFTGSNSNTFMA